MKTASIAWLLILFFGVSAPSQEMDTPASCLKKVRDFRAARNREAGRNLTAELNQQILREKTQRARECAARFSIDSVSSADAQLLAELYAEASQPEPAKLAIEKALSAPGLDGAAKSGALLAAVNIIMILSDSAGRDEQAESYVARLDALSDEALAQKIQAHGRMNSYYRAVDIDRGIIEHSGKLIELGRKLEVEEQKSYSFQLAAAYVNLAEAYAGQEQADMALEVLRRAPLELKGIERIEEQIRPILQRYQLVGKAAEPIEARTWLNASPGTTRFEPKGPVTLLQFTAHWCGPCRKSYPGIVALQKRFAGRGLKVVMATQLYGFFQGRRGLSAEEEIAADREYFGEHLGREIQVAVADPPVAPEGKPGRQVNINEARYHVGGIPQIHLIDRKGIHRLIMVGYDPANEARVAALIERLLKEGI